MVFLGGWCFPRAQQKQMENSDDQNNQTVQLEGEAVRDGGVGGEVGGLTR